MKCNMVTSSHWSRYFRKYRVRHLKLLSTNVGHVERFMASLIKLQFTSKWPSRSSFQNQSQEPDYEHSQPLRASATKNMSGKSYPWFCRELTSAMLLS